MRRFLLAAAAAALLPFQPGFAQEANSTEMETITAIARCLAQGLPDDWVSAQMVIKLERPGDSTGGVQYLVARKDVADKLDPFTPCDTDLPPSALISLRTRQPEDRRGWTAARLVLERDGNFRLNYDFPK